ncbi:MAG: hypothetical protein ACRCYE_00905, partial [Sarcina sp.]
EELPDGISLYNVEINEVNFEIKENIINLNVMDINETIDIKYKFIITDNFMKTQKINSKVCYKSLKNSIGDFKEKVSLNNSIIIEKYLVDIDIKIQRLDIGMLNGEEVYCVLLKNMGETNIENLSLQLNINTQMKYKVLVEEKEITNLTTLKKNEEIELRYKIKFEANRNFKDAQLECVLTGNYIYGDIVNEILIKRQSEIFIIDINEVNVTKEIFADYCFKGEDVEVLMKIENVGNSIVRNILLEDSIFNYDIVQDSFNINGQDLDYSIINSIMLDKIQPFEYSFVRFLIKTDNIEESYLKSITRIEGEFCNHKKFETYIKSFNPFYINLKSIRIDVSTNFSKKEFIYNEKIFVNTLIKNLGDIEIYNIEIDDVISEDLEILKYNLYLDGKKINNFFRNKKILVPKICEKGICEIKRELWYVGLRSNENIEMFMMMNYEYKDKKNRMKRMQIASEKNFLEGIINIRKKVKIESNINITMDRLKDINNINVKPKVSSSYLIDSLTTIKNDDEKFTGKKLIARGYIEIEIEYIAANLVENIYFQKEIKRFATYINLPKDFNENIFDLRIDANDISYEKISDNLIWSEVILDFNVII